MGDLVAAVTRLHQSTTRDYVARMVDNKTEAMHVARRFGPEYWDGDRRYGYGGYSYMPGRWKSVAIDLIDRYDLTAASSVLDVGCGKGFLLYELQLLLPGARLVGCDISTHALESCHPDFRGELFEHNAKMPMDFGDDEFDLVISLATLHNLQLFDLKTALQEVERVGRRSYVMVESYRTVEELFNLQCWALTARAFLEPDEWTWLFGEFGFRGDYEFIYFE